MNATYRNTYAPYFSIYQRSSWEFVDGQTISVDAVEVPGDIAYDEYHAADVDYMTPYMKQSYPIVLGGDHTAAYRALEARHMAGLDAPNIVIIDAHHDWWESDDADWKVLGYSPRRSLNHGNWLAYAVFAGFVKKVYLLGPRAGSMGAEIPSMKNAGVQVWWGAAPQEAIFANALDDIQKNRRGEDIWLSLDLDGMDPSCCPGVNTPEPGGFQTAEVLSFFGSLMSTCNVVGGDICELNPARDQSSMTAQFANVVMMEHLVNGQRRLG
jgi:arginase family enzyme